MPVKAKVSTVVSKQIPEFIRGDHETFVKFIEAYYEFLESTSTSPVKVIRSLQDLRDVDNTLDQFVSYLKSELIPGIPEDVLVDKRRLIKQIHDIYRCKGTIKSYELLFRILYNETPELYFPKVDVLRVSDGKWSQNLVLKAIAITGNPFNLVGQTITQGSVTARVENVTQVLTMTDPIYVISLNRKSISGTFNSDDPVTGLDNLDESEIEIELLQSVVSLSIVNPGSYFTVGQFLEFDDVNTGLGTKIQVSSVKTGSVEGVVVVTAGTGYSVGDEVEFETTSSGGIGARARVSEIDGFGGIVTVEVLNGGNFYSTLPLVHPPETGSDAVLVCYGSDIGRINGLEIHNSGYGYTSAPTVIPPVNVVVVELTGVFETGEEVVTYVEGFDLEDDSGNIILESGEGLANEGAEPHEPSSTGTISDYDGDLHLLTILPETVDDVFDDNYAIQGVSSGVLGVIQSAEQAVITATIGVLTTESGRFINADGMISDSSKHIQDSLFYQDYSYVIKVGQSINNYRNIVKKLLHPSGLALFGEVNLKTLITQSVSFADSKMVIHIDKLLDCQSSVSNEMEIDILSAVVSEGSSPILGAGLGWLEKWKFFFPPYEAGTKNTANINTDAVTGDYGETQIKHFADIRIIDIINNPYKKFNYCRDAVIELIES